MTTTIDDLDWRQHAACQANPELFFSGVSGDGAKARHICVHHCPVIEPCLADAKRTQPWACVQGGLIWSKDSALARKTTTGRPSAHQPIEPCGPHCQAVR